jgi:polyketide cyclase/dehydrase/lipid transport protein
LWVSGHVSLVSFIKAPRSRIWRLIEKHLEHPEVSPIEENPSGIQEVRGEPLSQQRHGIGTSTRWFYKYGSKPFTWDDEVVQWEPESRVEWKTTSRWNMRDSFNLRTVKEGTRLEYLMDYSLPYGPLGAIYGKLVLEPKMRRHLRGVLERLKRLSEDPFSSSV